MVPSDGKLYSQENTIIGNDTGREDPPGHHLQVPVAHYATLDVGDDEGSLGISGYRQNALKNVFCQVTYVLTCGLLRLLFHWRPDWLVKATCDPCSLSTAELILIRYSRVRKSRRANTRKKSS